MSLAKRDCKHPFQDAKYGTGIRVHNLKQVSKDTSKQGRCVVCGKERSV